MDNEQIIEKIQDIKKNAIRYYGKCSLHYFRALDLEVLINYFDEIIDLFKEEEDDNEAD